MFLHCMTVLGLNQMFFYSTEIVAIKEKKISVEDNLQYLPLTNIAGNLISSHSNLYAASEARERSG